MHPESPRSFFLNPLELGELELRDLVRRSSCPDALFEAAEQVLDGELDALPGANREETKAFAEEPHFLGWLHQHLGERARLESFQEHTQNESKHTDQSTTTQLFTPRWVADALVDELFALTGPATLLDPACGGGQMLLAWVDRLIAAGVAADEAFEMVRGVELDPDAAKVATRVLIHHARRHGVAFTPKIRVADSLFSDIEPAEVVLTNPPYMGSRSMDHALKARVRDAFAPYHADLYTAFLLRAHQLATRAVGILAQQTVWYLSRFSKARRDLLERGSMIWFAHLGPHVFRTLSGEKANVVAFVQRTDTTGEATRVVDVRDLPVEEKRRVLATGDARRMNFDAFLEIPGAPIAHWLRAPLFVRFRDGGRIADLFDIPGSQNKTGANRRFVRPWNAVPRDDITEATELWEGPASGRWRFYSKGGGFAPWWGNWNAVVDWSAEAREFYATNRTSNLVDAAWLGRPGLTYSDFGGQRFAARWLPPGAVFDMAGPAIFEPDDDEDLLYGLAVLLNTGAVRELLNALNPSIHYQVRDVRNLPLPADFSSATLRELAPLGRRLVDDARALHRAVAGDPLEGDLDIDAWRSRFEAFRDAEMQALSRVHELYEISVETPPVHHAFERILRSTS